MSLPSFLAAAAADANIVEKDAVSFLTKVWGSIAGTNAVKNIETMTVNSIASVLEVSVASLIPMPFSTAVQALIQQLATQLDADIAAQKPPTAAPVPGAA